MKWETKYQLEIEVDDGFNQTILELLAAFKSDELLKKAANYTEKKVTLNNLVIVRNSRTIVLTDTEINGNTDVLKFLLDCTRVIIGEYCKSIKSSLDSTAGHINRDYQSEKARFNYTRE